MTGVVTVWDVNRPGAHLFGFGLCLVVEAEVARSTELFVRRSEEQESGRLASPISRITALMRAAGASDHVDRFDRLRAEDRHLEPLAVTDVRGCLERSPEF